MDQLHLYLLPHLLLSKRDRPALGWQLSRVDTKRRALFFRRVTRVAVVGGPSRLVTPPLSCPSLKERKFKGTKRSCRHVKTARCRGANHLSRHPPDVVTPVGQVDRHNHGGGTCFRDALHRKCMQSKDHSLVNKEGNLAH